MTRHFILRIAIGLLTFCMGVVAAVVIGNINPFPRTRAVVFQSEFVAPGATTEGYRHCPHVQMRTADLKCKGHFGATSDDDVVIQRAEPLEPPPPPPPPAPPRVPRAR